jgi:hypothetical protein
MYDKDEKPKMPDFLVHKYFVRDFIDLLLRTDIYQYEIWPCEYDQDFVIFYADVIFPSVFLQTFLEYISKKYTPIKKGE